VTGMDQSPEFLAAAQRLAAAEGVGDRVEFLVGDVHELDFPAATFDAAVARMLLSHVRDPLAALGELRACSGPAAPSRSSTGTTRR
jgi:ubiquinone/menaquinone biosynthesis C-methylase UbiE